VLGATLILNGHPFEVVGVAPEEFRGPVSFANVPVYVPLMMQREIDPGRDLIEDRTSTMLNVVGRLRDGETLDRAQEIMDVMLVRLQEELPDSYGNQRGTTLVLQNEAGIHPTFRSAQLGMSSVIMVVVVLLLLIACLNVANLFLARARDRRGELGIRLALGAGRRRIVQQLLTESLVFSTIAGIAGLGLAGLVTRFLGNFRLPLDGPWSFAVNLNDTVLVFTLVVSVAAGLLFGMVPALQVARSGAAAAVNGESAQRGGFRPGRALVVLQMALSLLLLISSGLFLRSLKGAMEIDPGFDAPENLVMASVDPGLQGYDNARARAFFDRLVEDVEALPEVTRVGLSSSLPLGFANSDGSVTIPGYEFVDGERRSLQYALVTEGYLQTMGVTLLDGRTLARTDDEAGAPVIIVNQRFADRFWPGESAVGKTVRTAGRERTVIGVVATGKYRSLGEEPTEFMYLPQRELFTTGMTLVARTPSDPQAVLGAIRAVVREAATVDPMRALKTD
jgi:macrolide transport system ATP-binding/permease protein